MWEGGKVATSFSGESRGTEGQSHAAWSPLGSGSDCFPLRRAAGLRLRPLSPPRQDANHPPPQKLKTLGFISAASARKPGSAQAQCLPPQSRTEEGGSGAQHLRSGLSRINTKSLLYLPSNLNLSKFPLAVLELREEEILPTL